MKIDLTAPNKNGWSNVVPDPTGRWESDDPNDLAKMVEYASSKLPKDKLSSVVYVPKPLVAGKPCNYKLASKWQKTASGKGFPRHFVVITQDGGSTAVKSRL